MRDTLAEVLENAPSRIRRAVPPDLRQALRHRLGRYYPWETGFDHHNTPKPEPGEVNGPPDFVGIGVQKAGTSWWYSLLTDHPGVSVRPSIHHERHFFDRFGTHTFGPGDIGDYRAWFPRTAGALTGEWTPDYFYYPWVPSLLAQAAPQARLLLILRDPLERFRSGLSQVARDGAAHVGSILAEAVDRSLYAEALRRWLDNFPPEALLVLQYERCTADPAGQLALTYRFLGLVDDHTPSRLDRVEADATEASFPLSADVTQRLLEVFQREFSELARMVPALDLSLWSGTAHASG